MLSSEVRIHGNSSGLMPGPLGSSMRRFVAADETWVELDNYPVYLAPIEFWSTHFLVN